MAVDSFSNLRENYFI